MTSAQVKPTISPELLNQIDIRVGSIESVSDVANSEKLVALRVNFGDHVHTVLAGMKRERANPREIEGKRALFVVNLPPRKRAGIHRTQTTAMPSGAGRNVSHLLDLHAAFSPVCANAATYRARCPLEVLRSASCGR
jgi:tRNA-binding protein